MEIQEFETRQEDLSVIKDEIKKRLLEYRDNEREIDNQIERIENLESKLGSVGSPILSDMPKAPNSAADRMASQIAQKYDLEEKVRGLIHHQEEERGWIYSLTSHLRNADERAVIEMRYIDVESWPSVCKMLYGHENDYEDHYESKMRLTTKKHGRALMNMAIYVAENR